MVGTNKEERLSSTTLCTVFLSFKSLLVVFYELINVLIKKISGKSAARQGVVIKPKPSKNGVAISQNENGYIPPQQKVVKEVKDMPGPRTLPFFGTLMTSPALKSDDLMRANEEREKLYGPMVKEEYFWNQPFFIVLGTEEIRKVMKLNPLMRPAMEILTYYRTTKRDRYNTVGLVNAQGNLWKWIHGLFSSVTTNMSFVRSLLPMCNDVSCDAIEILAKETGPTKVLPDVMKNLIAEASFYTGLGKRMGFVGKGSGESKNLKLFSDCHSIYWKAFHKSMYGFPWWKWFPTKIWKDFTSAEDKMIEIISVLIDGLLEDKTAGGILGSVQRDALHKKDLHVVLQEFILGATEPLYHASLITLYWVSKYDHVYKKVIEELREQLPTKDSVVDESVLSNIPYLKACVLESFRICPPTPNVARILEEEVELGGYRLPPYSAVIIQTWHACLKDSNFYRAKEYIPERWLLQDGAPPFKPHDRQFLCNFGIGTRACLGRRIALQFLHTFLCKLLRRYRVKFVEDIDVRYEWLLAVQEPVTVEFLENDF